MLITSNTVKGRCPLCGEQHAVCGQRTSTTPVDQRIEEADAMAEVALYTVEINGQQRQMKLTPDDAEAMGATPVKSGGVASKSRKPANKARTAASKSDDED